MRVRIAKPKPTLGIQCSRCRRTRYYHSAREIEFCKCGDYPGIIVMGRIKYEDLSDGKEEERVAAYRAWARGVLNEQKKREGEASRHGAGRKVKFVFSKGRVMAKFKIVKRSPEASSKTTQSGSGKAGTKVEKVKAGRKGGNAAAGRFTGRTTGLSVTKFQNKSIEDNRKKKLTDEELVQLWKSEFPNAKSDYTTAIVKGVRGLYNRGKHGNDQPRVPVPEFDDDGNALPFRGEKAQAKRDAADEARREKKSAKAVKKSRG